MHMFPSKKTCLLLVVGCCLGFMLSSMIFTDTTKKLKQTISSFYLRHTQSSHNNLTKSYTIITSINHSSPVLKTPTFHQRQQDKWNVVLSGNGKMWKVQSSLCGRNTSEFFRATLITDVGSTPIYIYDPKIDVWVSNSIARFGSWEGNHLSILLSLLKQDQDLQFVDIGTNVGVFALAVAILGRRVVAVDALSMNIERLCSSVMEGNFSDQVNIIHNAFSDVYETVSLGMDKNNVGGTFVAKDKNANKVRGSLVVGSYGTVQTIKLDDVLTLPNFDFKKVIIKIDVEGYENRVFKGGEAFFQKVDVQAVLMEWAWLKTGVAGQEIINFMIRHNMEPHVPNINPQLLHFKDHAQWPSDVLWRKKPSIKPSIKT